MLTTGSGVSAADTSTSRFNSVLCHMIRYATKAYVIEADDKLYAKPLTNYHHVVTVNMPPPKTLTFLL